MDALRRTCERCRGWPAADKIDATRTQTYSVTCAPDKGRLTRSLLLECMSYPFDGISDSSRRDWQSRRGCQVVVRVTLRLPKFSSKWNDPTCATARAGYLPVISAYTPMLTSWRMK